MKAVRHTLSAVWQAIRGFFTKIRRVIGVAGQAVAQRDQLYELKEQTRYLGSASIESATYLSWELQAVNEKVSSVDERLERLESELKELRRLLEERQSALR